RSRRALHEGPDLDDREPGHRDLAGARAAASGGHASQGAGAREREQRGRIQRTRRGSMKPLDVEADLMKLVEQQLTLLGEDPTRAGIKRTPARVAKALQFLTSGYRHDVKKLVNGAIFEEKNQEMILVRDIELYSLCEHHMLPFFGKAHVAYIPDGRIIGLSKI